MATRNIVKIGDPVLRERAREVSSFDEKLAILIDDMVETMNAANGVGLAAPQVGILKRVCVVCTDGSEVYELINPVIVKAIGKQTGPEGCLSVPSRQGIVERPKKVVVDAFDRKGDKYRYTVEGFTARAFCHEIDHLDGTLYVDKMIREDV